MIIGNEYLEMGTRRKLRKWSFGLLLLCVVGILTLVSQLWTTIQDVKRDHIPQHNHDFDGTSLLERDGFRRKNTFIEEVHVYKRKQSSLKPAESKVSQVEREVYQLEHDILSTAALAADGLTQLEYERQKEPQIHMPDSSQTENVVNITQDSNSVISKAELVSNSSVLMDNKEDMNNKEIFVKDLGLSQNVEKNQNITNSVKEHDSFSNIASLNGWKKDVNRNEFAGDGIQNNLNFDLPTKLVPWKDHGDSWVTNSYKDGFSPVHRLQGQSSSVSNKLSNDIRIISMSLYGANPRYTVGAVRNAELAKENFPGWKLRVYTESPLSLAPRFGFVPRSVIDKLQSLGADIQYIVPEHDFIPPMMWRFLVADDLSVDYFIIRDSDSRLTSRDAAAVKAWVQSGKPFHSIRDHPSHSSYAISGGLWGGKTRELRNILRRSWIDLMRGTSSQYLEDMNFLNNVIWPRVQNHAYCSDSVSCDRWPNSFPFPAPRYGYDHVGQVFDERDLGRSIDIRILRAAGENPRCISVIGS